MKNLSKLENYFILCFISENIVEYFIIKKVCEKILRYFQSDKWTVVLYVVLKYSILLRNFFR